MATVDTATFKFEADTGEYVSNVGKADKATSDLDDSVKTSSSSFDVLNSKFVLVSGAAAGLVASLNAVAGATLTTGLNNQELQKNLSLTDDEMKSLDATNKQLGNTYGLSNSEMARMSALNSEYVGTAAGVEQANTLVAQSATLYALKEGDVTLSADQAITAQEALRDVILTGSTTAFEDSAISIDAYGEALIEANGWTKEQTAAITEGTNGTFEYVEALSKASSPQERFNALSKVTADEFENMKGEMDLATRSAYIWQTTVVNLQDIMMKLTTVLLVVVVTIGRLIYNSWQIIAVMAIVAGVVALCTTSFLAEAVAMIVANAALIALLAGVLLLMVAYVKFEIVQAIVNKLLAIFITVIQILLGVLIQLISLFVTYLVPVLLVIGKVLLELVIVAFQMLADIIVTYVLPTFQILWNFFVTYLLPVLVKLAQIIAKALIVVFQMWADLVVNYVLPTFQILWQFFVANLLPILIQLAQIIAKAVIVVFQALADLIVNYVLPTFQALWQFFVTYLLPILVSIAEFIANSLIVIFKALADLIVSYVLPTFQALWQFFVTYLLPILVNLAELVGNIVLTAFKILTDLIVNYVLPTFQALWQFFVTYLLPILLQLIDVVGTVLVTAFNVVSGIIQTLVLPVFNLFFDIIAKVLGKVKELIQALDPQLKKTLDLILKPIQLVINIMEELLDIIIRVTNAILDGLIGAFNSIPLVPNIDTNSSTTAQMSGLKSGINGAGYNSLDKSSNTTVNYTISYHKAPNLKQLQREQRFAKLHPGVI